MARAAQSRPASARAQQCLAVQQRAHPLPAAGKRTGRAMHGKGRLRQAPWVHRHRTRTRSTNLPRAGACHPRRHHQTWSMCGFRVQPPRPPRRLSSSDFTSLPERRSLDKKLPAQNSRSIILYRTRMEFLAHFSRTSDLSNPHPLTLTMN